MFEDVPIFVKIKKVRLSLHTSQVAHQAESYPRSIFTPPDFPPTPSDRMGC